MTLRYAISYLGRLALCALAFFFGITIGGMAAALLGLPSWHQILAAQLIRSLLFLAGRLPVLIAWQRSSCGLAIALGATLFVLVGLLGLIPGYWMPLGLRPIHGVEILADAFVYALALVLLLAPRAPAAGWKMTRRIRYSECVWRRP